MSNQFGRRFVTDISTGGTISIQVLERTSAYRLPFEQFEMTIAMPGVLQWTGYVTLDELAAMVEMARPKQPFPAALRGRDLVAVQAMLEEAEAFYRDYSALSVKPSPNVGWKPPQTGKG